MEFIQLRLPLVRPFRNARGEVAARDVIYVGVTDGHLIGWGEAAPWPGEGDGDADSVYAALVAGAPERWGAAAVDEARTDLAARAAGLPLSELIAGTTVTPPPSLAVGLDEDAAEVAGRAFAAGYRTIKLKVEPGNDTARVVAARTAAPSLQVAVDGNGAYSPGDNAAVLALAAAGAVYVEQPYPRGSHDAHRRLRASLDVPLVLDEDVRSLGDAEAVIGARAADVLVTKPAVLGMTACLRIHDLARSAGLATKPSGFLETSIGRGHSLALASLPAAAWADAAPASAFLAVDPVRPSDGGVGIGLEPDAELISGYVVARGSRS